MAIFGKLENIENRVSSNSFQKAFEYLKNIDDKFLEIKENECIKEFIDDKIFVLKQSYYTKNREDCFFESHKKFVDIQYIYKGREIMDVSTIEKLDLIADYDEATDFIKYSSNSDYSSIFIDEKNLAIFYPEDAHQPCIKIDKSELIFKAVIKIPIELI